MDLFMHPSSVRLFLFSLIGLRHTCVGVTVRREMKEREVNYVAVLLLGSSTSCSRSCMIEHERAVFVRRIETIRTGL
jgi:hypothetical protein